MMSRRGTIWRNESGALTIEFVVVFMAFIATFFFVVELITYLFFMQTLEKAAQMGVRAAVVSDAVVNDPSSTPVIPLRNARLDETVTFGAHCSRTDVCAEFPDQECGGTGNACPNTVAYDRIFAHMNSIAGQLEPEHVSIRYEYIGLGFAGGPVAPMVTVTVEGVPYNTGVFGLLLGNVGVLQTLPTRSASMTGEDLQS